MTRSIRRVVIVLALVVASAVGYGCRGGGGQGDAGAVAHACPMRCEEDKTYDHTGSCPVCGMDLVEVRADGTLVMPGPPQPGGGTP
jgi:hypothetical protein